MKTGHIQGELHRWIGAREWGNAMAFTGHLRFSVSDRYAGTKNDRYLAAIKQNRFFCARLDRAVYGSSAKVARGGKRVPRVLVVEEGVLRTHVHGCFAFPNWVDETKAADTLKACWIAGPYGLNDARCDPMVSSTFTSLADPSWFSYIFKQVDAESFSVDYQSLLLPAADIN
jgi:hypothetical protein